MTESLNDYSGESRSKKLDDIKVGEWEKSKPLPPAGTGTAAEYLYDEEKNAATADMQLCEVTKTKRDKIKSKRRANAKASSNT